MQMTDSNKENQKMVKRTCRKGYVHCTIHPRKMITQMIRMSLDQFAEIVNAIETER